MNLFAGASLWGPLKELWEAVEGAIWRRQPESVHLLDLQLKKHKPSFLTLFKNPVGLLSIDVENCNCTVIKFGVLLSKWFRVSKCIICCKIQYFFAK